MAETPPGRKISRPWSDEEDDHLRALVHANRRLPDIAAELGRPFESVRSRAGILKLPLRTAARAWRPMNRPG